MPGPLQSPMKLVLVRFLVVAVPGLCFVIAGTLSDQYPVVALGGFFVIDAIYGLSRKRTVILGKSDQKRQRLSFVLAGIIGASSTVSAILEHTYWLAAVGIVILIGALLRLYGNGLTNRY